MQNLYCWRCNADKPMLDETEFRAVSELLPEGIAATEAFREQAGLAPGEFNLQERFIPALEAYHRITGFREANPDVLWHHSLSLYGPPCPGCGRPFRTPKAPLCAACGFFPGTTPP